MSGVDQSGGSAGGEPVTYVHLNPPHTQYSSHTVRRKGQNVTPKGGKMRFYILDRILC